jgi:hypothetical protein
MNELLYFALGAAGLVVLIALILAPFRLYSIARELEWQHDEMERQTRLLREIRDTKSA